LPTQRCGRIRRPDGTILRLGVGGWQYEEGVKENKTVIRIILTRNNYHEGNFQNITTIPVSYQEIQSTVPKQQIIRYQLCTLNFEDFDNTELHLNTQSVPRSKHSGSGLSNETSSCCRGT